VPALLSSLIAVSRDDLSAALAREEPSCPCLREWLARVPDPRRPKGRWHPLEFVLALAVCAFTAAGHDSPQAIADWAAGCSQETLRALGGRRDPLAGQVRPPCERTFRRVFTRADDWAVNDAVHGYLAAVPQASRAQPTRGRHDAAQPFAVAGNKRRAWPASSGASYFHPLRAGLILEVARRNIAGHRVFFDPGNANVTPCLALAGPRSWPSSRRT
jgi:hypothetical protein